MLVVTKDSLDEDFYFQSPSMPWQQITTQHSAFDIDFAKSTPSFSSQWSAFDYFTYYYLYGAEKVLNLFNCSAS